MVAAADLAADHSYDVLNLADLEAECGGAVHAQITMPPAITVTQLVKGVTVLWVHPEQQLHRP